MKDQMILAVEQKNLALRGRQFFTKRLCELYGRKPASDNNNSYGLHFLAPATRVVDFHLSWDAVDFNAIQNTSASRSSIGTKQPPVYRKRVNSIGMWRVLNSQPIALTLG